jgi:hypothetical protein
MLPAVEDLAMNAIQFENLQVANTFILSPGNAGAAPLDIVKNLLGLTLR